MAQSRLGPVGTHRGNPLPGPHVAPEIHEILTPLGPRRSDRVTQVVGQVSVSEASGLGVPSWRPASDERGAT